jgi:CheY-like chemotaxis protein
VIDLNNLLKLSVDMFGRTKKDIVITLDLAPELWGVQADEDQIKQVLMNLFVNALQAMPEGGTINVSSENVLIPEDTVKESGFKQAGRHVKVTVSDTGCGISKDIIDQIFDPFFTTKERGKGTGLGLATAYGIIKSHKGILKADSFPGRGSLFSIFLPAQETKADSMTEPGPAQTVICGKGNILLVDDEPGVIEVCSEMLTAMGYRVTAVTGGEEAIEAVKSTDKNFDMVILDLVMPGMDGEQAFEEIRRIKPYVRVLISSGYSKKEKIEQLVEKGCDGYILKPFDMVALSRKINSICLSSQAVKE